MRCAGHAEDLVLIEDAYWIRQQGDDKTWEEVNLFRNPLSLFITEYSLSGRNVHFSPSIRGFRTKGKNLLTMAAD